MAQPTGGGERWGPIMELKPFTVVCVPDGAADLEESTFVAHVLAKTISEAMAKAQNQAVESGAGPHEPIDWAVVFMCDGHHRNINDDPDTSTEA